MGWLNATVTGKDHSRSKLYDKDDPFNRMPSIEGFEYIVSMWHKAGMISRGGMSAAPLTWQDVDSFSKFNCIDSFEASMIVELSRSFIDGLNMKESNDKAPYKVVMTQEDWIARERSIENQLNKSENDIKNAAR